MADRVPVKVKSGHLHQFESGDTINSTYLGTHNHAASNITSGQLALARGGTNADLSATGGTSQFLRQSSAGAAITVSAIAHADLGSGGGTGAKYLCDNMTWESAAGMLSDLGAVSGRGSGAATRLAYWSDANTLTSDGDLLFDGMNMALGLALESGIRLAVEWSPADPATAPTGMRVVVAPSYSTHTAHTLRGHYGYLSISSGSGINYTSGSLSAGIHGHYNYAATGTYTIAAGVYGLASHNGGGTVTTIIGLAGQLQHLSTGGGTNAYALWAGTPSASGSGTYTQGVGLHVADQSVARYTTSHGIRIADQGSGAGTTWALGVVGADDQSYIAGSLMVGQASAPARKLEVRSATAQQRWSYDASNYAEIAVSSAGAVTLTATGASDGFCIGDSSDNIGFYGVTTVARPAAYTQTYSTADRTLSAYTPDSESVAYTGAVDGEAKLADLNALRVAHENLRAFVEDLAQMVNSVTDDLQAVGLLQ